MSQGRECPALETAVQKLLDSTTNQDRINACKIIAFSIEDPTQINRQVGENLIATLCDTGEHREADDSLRHTVSLLLANLVATGARDLQDLLAVPSVVSAIAAMGRQAKSNAARQWIATAIANIACCSSQGQHVVTNKEVRAMLLRLGTAFSNNEPISDEVREWISAAIANISYDCKRGKALLATAPIRDLLVGYAVSSRSSSTKEAVCRALTNVTAYCISSQKLLCGAQSRDALLTLANNIASPNTTQGRDLDIAIRWFATALTNIVSFAPAAKDYSTAEVRDCLLNLGALAKSDEAVEWIVRAFTMLTTFSSTSQEIFVANLKILELIQSWGKRAEVDSTREWIAKLIYGLAECCPAGQTMLTSPAVRDMLLHIGSATSNADVREYVVSAIVVLTDDNLHGAKLMATNDVRDWLVSCVSPGVHDELLEWVATAIAHIAQDQADGQPIMSTAKVRETLVFLARTLKSVEALTWTMRAFAEICANNQLGKMAMAKTEVRDAILQAAKQSESVELIQWILICLRNLLAGNSGAALLFCTSEFCQTIGGLAKFCATDFLREHWARLVTTLIGAGGPDSAARRFFSTLQIHNVLCEFGAMAAEDEARVWVCYVMVNLMHQSNVGFWRFSSLDLLESIQRTLHSQAAKDRLATACRGLQCMLTIRDSTATEDKNGSIALPCEENGVLHVPLLYGIERKLHDLAVLIAASCKNLSPFQVLLHMWLPSAEKWTPVNSDDDLLHYDGSCIFRLTQFPYTVDRGTEHFTISQTPLGKSNFSDSFTFSGRGWRLVGKRWSALDPIKGKQFEITAANVKAISSAIDQEIGKQWGIPYHPNIAPPLGVLTNDWTLGEAGDASAEIVKDVPMYILHERFDRSLTQEIARGQLLDPDACRISLGILFGLVHLHSHGRAHGHLSSNNVLLDSHRVVVVNAEGRIALSVMRQQCPVFFDAHGGTSIEAPPEYSGAAPMGFLGSDDMWSFGIIALEMAAAIRRIPSLKKRFISEVLCPNGRKGAPGQKELTTFLQSVSLPSHWAQIVRGCLNVQPSQRLTPVAVQALLIPYTRV